MIRTLSIALLALSCAVSAQDNSEIDSLTAVLQQNKPSQTLADTAVAETLSRLARAWINEGKIDSTLACTAEAVRILNAVPNGTESSAVNHQLLMAHKLSAMAYYYSSEYAKSLVSAQEMQRIAERLNEPDNIGAAMNYQAYSLREMDLNERAKATTLGAINILLTIPEDEDIANAYTGLASIYSGEAKYDSSVFYNEKALTIYERTGNQMNAANTTLNLADDLNSAGEYERSFALLKEVAPVIIDGGYPPTLCILYGQMGRALFIHKDYDQAWDELTLAEEQARIIENDEDIARINYLQGLVQAALGNTTKAIALIKEGENAQARDLDLSKVEEMTEARLAFEQEKKDAVAAAITARERKEKTILYIGSAILLLLSLLLYSLMVKSRKTSKILAAKNEEIMRTQNQLVAETKHREAEQVRTRIARDIHDELGGDLTKISLLSSEIQRRLGNDQKDLLPMLQSLGRVSREANAALKDIVWSVDPDQDTWQGLVNHAEVYTNRILEGSNLQRELHFEFKGPDATLDPASKQNIFLVLKEALNNAIKHANGTSINVRLNTSPTGYELSVLDNGTGFVENTGHTESHGLKNMRARAIALRAVLSLTSTDKGTQLDMKGTIPV